MDLKCNNMRKGDVFRCIFLNDSVWISITISLPFIPMGSINNIQALLLNQCWLVNWHICTSLGLSELMLYKIKQYA